MDGGILTEADHMPTHMTTWRPPAKRLYCRQLPRNPYLALQLVFTPSSVLSRLICRPTACLHSVFCTLSSDLSSHLQPVQSTSASLLISEQELDMRSEAKRVRCPHSAHGTSDWRAEEPRGHEQGISDRWTPRTSRSLAISECSPFPSYSPPQSCSSLPKLILLASPAPCEQYAHAMDDGLMYAKQGHFALLGHRHESKVCAPAS